MSYGTDVEGSLSTDNLWGEWMQGWNILVGLILEVFIVSIQYFDLFLGKSFDILHVRTNEKIKEIMIMIFLFDNKSIFI